ncbi:MAG: hypothetical protein MZV65_30240 [Chromatiales bacterium]|nr:hypothetical protein [Chromatiales bacterium]
MGRYLTLLNWACSYFDDGKLKESLTLEDAATAKDLDFEDLFATGHEHTELAYQRQSAVAGVAAILLLEKAEAHLQWAVESVRSCCADAGGAATVFTRSAKLMHHPVLYATKGLGELFAVAEDDEDVKPLQSLLTELCAHPYEEIAVAAFGALLECLAAVSGNRVGSDAAGYGASAFRGAVWSCRNAEARHYARIERVVTEELQRIQDRAPVAPADLA